ncbi:PAS domain S-box protein [Echinicola soli]|uniref:histidine kinase n=1 Tax=Echinicola soli TaxID=2591634 RepID=A0A514CMZ1_9BACT|nr:CheR family methyltransferase [Echinicola soli]QDH81160.1 PAS domain S-box protein [Echinicola soli]
MTTKKSKSKSAVSDSQPASQGQFPIVAIGSSAGGLEAMMELLKHLPSDTGMAFIYVQHLSPDHKSMLTDILSKKTVMKVQEIDDMDKIEPDNVFVIPYNKGIEVTDGHIKLIPRSESSSAISIDILFSSLAQAQKERVIGIVLSGNASDGTLGLKDIKHEGGLTFAQDDTATFTSMPHSAISAGVADYILSPKEIAHELERLSKHPFVNKNASNNVSEDLVEPDIHRDNPDLKNIFNQLHKATGVDFGVYKMNTIKRRILRRMLLYKISTLNEYAKLLREKNEEIDILYQDLLINVTSFFRDIDTHKYLEENLFPKLLKRKKGGEVLRIWVPACATGEEAYSIAMMLHEVNENQTTNTPIQIFATDLSEQAIDKARIGVYSKQELETVSPARITRFFTKTDGKFRVNKVIRNICVFAPHNILRDPPFSRLDFISCRNLLIYFDTTAQKKALNIFHYALNNDGYLILGKSENIGQLTNLFSSSNKKYKIFSRKTRSGSQRLPEFSPELTKQPVSERNTPVANRDFMQKDNSKSLDKTIDSVLVSEFMPASVVIDYQHEIIQFRGTTDLFLTHPKGKATFNILKMARPEIGFELRNAISKVIKSKERIRIGEIEMKVDSKIRIVSFEIVPLEIEWDEPLLLIVFTEHEQTEIYADLVKSGKNDSPTKDRRIQKLERQLATAHTDSLFASLEHEAFAEELQSANEEVVSSNEELQTVNEELETSKEEIESTNEELTTTNQELQTRIDLLNESYEYSEAIVSTMHDPMLVLGKDFRVKSANKKFYKTFGFNEEQTEGVPLFDLGNKQWDIPALRELLEDIIPKNTQIYNFEVKQTFASLGEKIMSLNASRIVQKTHREQLILLIISDITEVRRLIVEKEQREKKLLKKEIRERKAEKSRLEQAVNKRTQELKEANESLVNKNKELKAFTYVSSHDLQEPLRKLQTFAGIISEREEQHLSDKGKNYFRLIQQETERMRQLIQDLLGFSSLSAGERKFKTIDLNIIIDEAIEDFKEAITEKNAIIEFNETCEVLIIPFQFRQLMHNLIGNALKYSNPETTPLIKISSHIVAYEKLDIKELPPQKEYCQITISDNGIGFEQKFSNKIFEVLQKLHGKEEYPGTGIGLAIVKKIVDNHNGIITATSELNKGAIFTIYLPTSQVSIFHN